MPGLPGCPFLRLDNLLNVTLASFTTSVTVYACNCIQINEFLIGTGVAGCQQLVGQLEKVDARCKNFES